MVLSSWKQIRRISVNQGQTVFAQLIQHLSHNEFRRCVDRYRGNHRIRSFSCWDQFLTMAFAQLTFRESLREIEDSLGALQSKLYHMGLHSAVKRSTLADANETRDWRIFADFAHSLISIARPLYHDSPLDIDFGEDLEARLYALDATVIDLCLTLFPWAQHRRAKSAVKLHTLLEVRTNIPVFIDITAGSRHEVSVLDLLQLPPGSYLVMDRAYVDFQRLYRLHQLGIYFFIRAKENLAYARRCSRSVDKSTGLRSDQSIYLTGPKSSQLYPDLLRRIHYYAAEKDLRFQYLTNNFVLSPLSVAAIYLHRWTIELFFKWIKQNLRIKAFFGTSPNSVKIQIWIAVTVYVLVAIVKKRLGLPHSFSQILQILSLTLFEKVPILSLFQGDLVQLDVGPFRNQLKLLNI
jgi:IS4 transposase